MDFPNPLSPGEQKYLQRGEILFYEGDPSDMLYFLVSGCCALTWGAESRGEAHTGEWLDLTASLGGLPRSVKITALEACELSAWSLPDLWQIEDFNIAARRWLATALQSARQDVAELRAPIHYQPDTAQLIPGPFRFEGVNMLFVFCEIQRGVIGLPDGLKVMQRPGRDSLPLLLALARFPKSYPEHSPNATFAYTETTYFIPVREGTRWGLYVPHIYSSAWEPILLGREIYGFPKRLGQTRFESNTVALTVDTEPYLHFSWEGAEASDETRLVRAFGSWLGFPGIATAAAFRAGEVLRKVNRLPAHRRVLVYNHKQVLAAESDSTAPHFALDELTRAVFGVLGWQQITALRSPLLEVIGGPFKEAGLTIREAFRTTLDMRLSLGKVERDYRKENP
jgi:hypothetical protein